LICGTKAMVPAAWFKNSESNTAGVTEALRPLPPRSSDLDVAKGLAFAVPVGLACWGVFGWLLWRLL
jgi:hypothetical protein